MPATRPETLERLGLGPESVDAVREALGELQQEGEGIDFVSVFERVARGSTLREALGLPRAVVDLLYAQAFVRFEARDTTEALRLFQALSVLAPEVKDHWLGLGICMRLIGQTSHAMIAFDTAEALDPGCPAVLFHRAELKCQSEDWAGALADCQRFRNLPDSALKARLAPEVQRYAAMAERRRG